MEQTFMKEKKILPLVLSMSLPMMLSMLVNSLYNIVDSYYWKCYVRSGRGIIPASVRTADRRNDRYCTFSEQIDRIIRFDVRAGI